ncbi:MAG TPA: metallophosphoesterase [Terriglobales bacterium]|nr:metallophosphoesterase [Terriglobales bacterium]
MRLLTRRRFLKTSAAVAGAGTLALASDGLYEANHPRVVAMDMPLPRLPQAWDGLRVVQLSDFHYDPTFSVVPIRKAAEVVNGLRPDLILLTGDFITVPLPDVSSRSRASRAAAGAGPCAEILAPLRAPYGVWAGMGNHDAFSDEALVIETLQHYGIKTLRNACTALERGNSRLWLAGIDDLLEGEPDIDKTLAGIPPSEPVILMAHEPDFAIQLAGSYAVDFQLSGHSHGGQVRLPFVGAVVLPSMARRYPMGFYDLGALKLYTNVGIGTVRLAVRLNCPPEITVFTLRSGKKMA